MLCEVQNLYFLLSQCSSNGFSLVCYLHNAYTSSPVDKNYVPTRQVGQPRMGFERKTESQFLASGYPKLIDVTLEELETGLESGLFTSVDLVNVNQPTAVFRAKY